MAGVSIDEATVEDHSQPGGDADNVPGPAPRAALDNLSRFLVPSSSSTDMVPPVAVMCDIPPGKGPPVADDSASEDSDEDELAWEPKELTDPVIAEEMNTFLGKLQCCGEWIGLSAFVIFSLAFRIQVRAWLNTELHDVLHMKHSYWSTGLTDIYIQKVAAYNAIRCRISGEGKQRDIDPLLNNDAFSMNHWIAGVRVGHPKQYEHEPFLYASDDSVFMDGIYSSIGIHLLRTVSDGVSDKRKRQAAGYRSFVE